ncbi:MAG: NAD(P)H-hydrate dehydratase [Endomicrobium sp.]|jgi:NAD(P)H-hydrate epimerase|nr:NAD(P)H-hydrate dehydratase [Endomicrobium sp.]
MNEYEINNFINKLKRHSNTHKYDYGHSLVIAGSKYMPGAGILCCLGAMHAGIGLVTYAVKKSFFYQSCMMAKPEILFCVYKTVDDIFNYIKKRKVSSIVIGPGLKVSKDNKNFIIKIISSLNIPIILDASGISCFNNDVKSIMNNINVKGRVILTPHCGEFAKLLNIDVNLLKHLNNKKSIIKNFVVSNNILCILKGSQTIVADYSNIYINNTGTPAMATAGSGDVLSGAISAFVNYTIDIFEATKFAVFIHGLAGEWTEYIKGTVGILASDVAANISLIIHQLMYNQKLINEIHSNIKQHYL